MPLAYQPVIGLEVHAELQTRSKMFCRCPVVDLVEARPNEAVCPVCAGMPGVLPVLNRRAVEYGVRVALALECEVALTSVFERKNYFYPDLPKGYQISQYVYPLARRGRLRIQTDEGERDVRIRRVHLEEDTGKLTHVNGEVEAHSLVDINRAGVPLLEIVSEPDLHSAADVRAYAEELRAVLRYLGVNSGDMEKGLLRIEPNVSVRPAGSETFGTRVEIKNLNSFRALERAVQFEIGRQTALLRTGANIRQETLGWDEKTGETFTQRVKETEDDYRYFPEPDLPPLVLTASWIEDIRANLPELPAARRRRFEVEFGLSGYDASVLVAEQAVADYFEAAVQAGGPLPPKVIANWITGELFALLNQAGGTITQVLVTPEKLGSLVALVEAGEINSNTGKKVLAEMFASGRPAEEIIEAGGLGQINDPEIVAALVANVLAANPAQVAEYRGGKKGARQWLFGQVMRASDGRANPGLIRQELDRQL